jgi:predicted esterase
MAQLIKHRILEDFDGLRDTAKKPQRVVIMLHGMGQHPGYMEEAGRLFAAKMPGTLVVMPEGPLKMKYSAAKTAGIREKYDPAFDPDQARSWFNTNPLGWPLMSLKLAFNSLSVVHQVNALADHYRDKYGLQDKDIAFFGMSQGGAVALYAALGRKQPSAGVVSHSGMFFGFARAKAKPDVLMITGEDDNILCANKSFSKSFWVSPERGMRRLARRGIKVTEFRCPNLGHAMNAETLGRSAEFLAGAFGVPANTDAAPKPAPVTATLS